MALTITTDLTVITSAETGDSGNWTDLGGGSGSAQDGDYSVQGSQSRTRAVSGAAASRGMVYDIAAAAPTGTLDFSASGTEEDMLIYMWISTFSPGLVDALSAAPGLRIRLASDANPDTGAWSEWDIMYSDLLASEGTELYKMYVLDPRAPTTRINSGGVDLAAIRWFGARMDTNAGAKGSNLGIDQIAYGFGELIATGTATDASSGIQEMIDWDWGTKSNRYGILTRDEAGNVSCKGKLVIGDGDGTLSTTLTAQDTQIKWAPTYYYDGTRVRPTVGYDSAGEWLGRKGDGTAYYGVDIRGNGTGDTDVTLGAAVGTTQGRSGPTFIGSRQIPTEFTADDGAVEDVLVYGMTIQDFRKIDFSGNALTDEMMSCTLKNCGTLDIGPTIGRNNSIINGLGGGYEFLEYFLNREASGAEQLSTADPTTEWTDSLNGTDWSVPSDTAGYVELLGGTTRTNLTILDDDKVGSDDHYAEFIARFPSGGATQGTLGPVIACHLTVDDYFWVEVDLASDTIELFRTNTGTDTSIDGPTAFTMDEDEDYIILLRRSGTTIEAFASGNSVAGGRHTTKLSATDSAHTGTAQRLVGLRGDALSGQTGDAPQVRLFGAGPITDNLGSVVFPAAGDVDFETATLINCARALSFDTVSSPSLVELTLSGNLVDAHNDSGGLVTGSVTDGTVPLAIENTGSSTSDFPLTVTIAAHVEDKSGVAIENAQVYIQKQTPTAYTSGAGNTAADADIVLTQTLDDDTPSSGTIKVYDRSLDATQPYRYASHDGTNTLTLPSEVTFACTGGGTGTSLEDSVNDFTAIDIVEGDTVRNTTDGSWAVVDEIVGASAITTSPLQGGTDDTWTSGDTYSFHRLATTLVSAVDTVDLPVMNTQTNASGDASVSFPYTDDRDVRVRVRSVGGATRYIDFVTTDTIDNGGLSVTVVMDEDTVYEP